jgi:hypothetical protein
MKRSPILLVALVLMAGCGDSDTAPADEEVVQFTAQLLTSNEVPPITSTEAPATGVGFVDFVLTRDAAGAITTAYANFRFEVSGFPSTSTISNAHVHTGAAGVNGGIVVNPNFVAGEAPLTNGSATFQRLNISGAAFTTATAQAIINNPAGFYFNVHSSAHPAGVMRGQLVRQ